MNTPSDAVSVHTLDVPVSAPVPSTTWPWCWSVRRELWENRSLYIAPLVVATIELVAFAIGTVHLPASMRPRLALDPAQTQTVLGRPAYDFAAFLLLITGFIVGVFYCLDALHSERRDRSILFWKSLPVSDTTTVLSKATIPLLILPAFLFVIIIATHLIMLLVSTAVLLVRGVSAGALWNGLSLFQASFALLYALVVIALWYAPIYGFLLLISGLARRATFLWAALPPFGIYVFEKIAFGTSHFSRWCNYRLYGWFVQAFKHPLPTQPLATLDPAKFLSTPGLWTGLGAAAICLLAAVKLRRCRGPV